MTFVNVNVSPIFLPCEVGVIVALLGGLKGIKDVMHLVQFLVVFVDGSCFYCASKNDSFQKHCKLKLKACLHSWRLSPYDSLLNQ